MEPWVGPVDAERIVEAEKAILGDKHASPNWLQLGLQRAALALGNDVGKEVSFAKQNTDADDKWLFPTRSDLRDRLTALSAAAELIIKELSDPAILSFLKPGEVVRIEGSREVEWSSALEDERALHRILPQIARRATAQAGLIPSGGGKGKYYPRPNGLSPFEACALYVVLAWREVRGMTPGVDDGVAYQACEALWRAAGAPKHGYSDKPTGWRDHIRKVLPLRDTDAARMMRSTLIGTK